MKKQKTILTDMKELGGIRQQIVECGDVQPTYQPMTEEEFREAIQLDIEVHERQNNNVTLKPLIFYKSL